MENFYQHLFVSMNTRKQQIVDLLRQLRLLSLADYIRYLMDLKNNRVRNKTFIEAHPDFRLPPSELAYDAYGHTNWDAYYCTGIDHAQYISNLIRKNSSINSFAICEWGCGPARILRHLPLFFEGCNLSLYGFDYNPKTIKWCQDNINNIVFNQNFLSPPLNQDADSFDCLYCVSVFTHLSRDMHFAWMKEISRVVKPNGLLIITTHGEPAKAHLLKREQQVFEMGELVIRDKVKEGKRTFVAYQPTSFVREKLLADLVVVEHITNPIPSNLTQDIWVVKNAKT